MGTVGGFPGRLKASCSCRLLPRHTFLAFAFQLVTSFPCSIDNTASILVATDCNCHFRSPPLDAGFLFSKEVDRHAIETWISLQPREPYCLPPMGMM